jgi:S1-C subfamily serine protease
MKGRARTWLLSILLALPMVASAGHWAYQSDRTLRWHDDGRYLHLAMDKQGGVAVLGVSPAGLWGLGEGDIIVQADGRPVSDVTGLLATLRAHGDTPMPLVLRHAGVERTALLASEAHALVSTSPPAMPAAKPTATSTQAPSRLVFQSNNSLRWRSDGRRLHLVTGKDKDSVEVVAVVPDTLWGLVKGDRILAANEQPVHSVAELLGWLHQPADAPVSLRVRRGGTEQTVQLASDARELVATTAAAGADH